MRLSSMERYSTRCNISHRPPFRTEEPLFFRCSQCGNFAVIHPAGKNGMHPIISCCGEKISPLKVCKDPEIVQTHGVDFTIFGGFEHNSIRIAIDKGYHPMEANHRIEWIYLRTFQGGQFKMLPDKGRSVAHFSLADEDAYVYCNREICRMGREHCQFACKRGMTVYTYCSRHGLTACKLTDSKD